MTEIENADIEITEEVVEKLCDECPFKEDAIEAIKSCVAGTVLEGTYVFDGIKVVCEEAEQHRAKL